jgi:ferredoxin
MFRIEAFGDTASAVQAANYITLAYSHPYLLDVGVWSKNLGFWHIAYGVMGKPANMTFNASSPVLNTPIAIKPEYEWFIDHVFTVYDAAAAIGGNIDINCGERICANCRRCYTKGNGVAVNEILKQESKRYYKAIGKTFTGRK